MGIKEDREQLMLELVNRARMDPLGEAARYGLADLNQGLPAGTISSAPKQVLAYNPLLFNAAEGHNAWLAATDNFSHTGNGGTTFGQRILAAGYNYNNAAENLALTAATPVYDANAHVFVHHQNLFLSEGHRKNLLNPVYEEIGISMITDPYQGMPGMVTTQNFGAMTDGQSFITGVHYTDADNNDFYSIGEGSSGRTVSVYNGSGTLLGTTSTAAAGGYSYKVASTGSYEVVFSGGGLFAEMGASLSMPGSNVKVDLTDGNTIETNASATLTRSSANLTLLGIDNINGTGNSGNNIIKGNKGNNALDGAAGIDTLNGGDGADTLNGGAGNDTLDGGLGTDTAVFSGALSFYVVNYNASTQTYTFYGNDGAIDTIKGVENFQFADGTRTAAQLPVSAAAPQRTASVSAVTPAQAEGNSGTTAYTFTVTLNAAAYSTQTVNYAVAGSGVAPANAADFTGSLSGTVTFLPGESSKTVTVLVTGDMVVETDEAFTVTLSAPSSGLVLGTAAVMATITNDDTSGPNTINGTAGNDVLNGTVGIDVVNALAGNDTLYGGDGDDELNGGDGDDKLHSGLGADDLNGGNGTDFAYYTTSDAAVTVNLTTNIHSGGHAEGDSFTSIERVYGSIYNDHITGDGLANALYGHNGNDTLLGMAGHDSLFGGNGNDTLGGGEGNDTFDGGAGADQIDGDLGTDTLTYASSNAGVTVNLLTNVNTGGHAESDDILGVEKVTGSQYADNITGDDLANTLSGGLGDDVLNGGGGNDILIGGAGADQLDGGAGTADFAYYTASAAAVTVNLTTNVNMGGDAEGDSLFNIERAYGSLHNDSLTGNGLANSLYGYNGNDTLNGMAGNDYLHGGTGADTFVFSGLSVGTDTIADYVDGTDQIEFQGFAGLDFLSLNFAGQGTTTVTISGFDGASSVIVKSASAFTIDASDIAFT
jgi:Ca2+-binding RTX toxin-like protein